ncbi:helix-turn-helix domain-containing protein [Isoptericola sp. 4D.3]|uniref:Helix-turn-helix domain-containing protein n=1 Tax=Isoptericola peretonis TaxID=2918523 RepID=A0ABT0J495_9MICO|nr:helix-turn-helix domain-containing protein [Isoptericola sp. 4D.3]
MTTPVEGFALRTTDAQEAEQALAAVFPRVHLRAPKEAFEFSIRSATIEHVAWTDHTLPMPGNSALDEPEPIVVLHLRGDIRLEHAGQAFGPGPALLDSPERATATWETARTSGFALDREYVRAVATRLTGRQQPSHLFRSGHPRGPAEARAWKATARYAAESLTVGSEALSSAVLQRSLVHHLALTLLHTFPNAALDDLRGAERALPPVVRRAMAFVDEHAHEPVTVDDVAAAVHVSTRGLQAAFRRSLGITPSEALRRARLDGVRRELLAADPGATTVAVVAHRWGFLHLGHFSAAYRRAHDELPSETLRR